MNFGYVRVSGKSQEYNNSIPVQTAAILDRYPDAEIVTEIYSGAKDREKFLALLDKLQAGDVLVVTRLDRFCRTVKEGLDHLDKLLARGVVVHILNMGLIEDTPMGRLIVTQMLAFAEFERAIIQERTTEGKNRARTQPDYREGRPPKYGKKQLAHALELLQTHSYRQVEQLTGISISTLQRARRRVR